MEPVKTFISMIMMIFFVGILILGLFSFANTVAPIDKLHEQHIEDRR